MGRKEQRHGWWEMILLVARPGGWAVDEESNILEEGLCGGLSGEDGD